MELTDFLGHTFGPGDLVIYAAMSGRCANMVVGRVVDIYQVWHNCYYVGERYGWERLADGEPVPHHFRHDGKDLGECDSGLRVKVQPLRAARWTQHHGHDYYVDTRTGKRIDPWRGKGRPHILVEGHYRNKVTKEPIPDSARYDQRHPKYCGPDGYEDVSTEFQPWVEQRNDGPKPVTLEITDNIVRWEGDLPDAGVPVQVP